MFPLAITGIESASLETIIGHMTQIKRVTRSKSQVQVYAVSVYVLDCPDVLPAGDARVRPFLNYRSPVDREHPAPGFLQNLCVGHCLFNVRKNSDLAANRDPKGAYFLNCGQKTAKIYF